MKTKVFTRRATAVAVLCALVLAACSGDDSTAVTTTTAADAPTTTTDSSGLTGEGLAVGVLTPAPGLGATLFQAQSRGIRFATDDIDGGGGVLEGPLGVTSFDTPLGSNEADVIDAAVEGGSRVLIGPAGSTAAREAIPALVRLNTLTCSASATLPNLTYGQEQLNLFRTALPADALSAYVADQIVARRDAEAKDAAWNVTIVARGDDYGLSLGNGLAVSLKARGLNPSVVGYNARRVTFEGTAQEVVATNPNLTVLVSYEEGGNLLSALLSAGLPPASMIGLDGFFAPRVASIAAGSNPASVDGFAVIGTTGNRAFLQRLIEDDSNGQVAFAAQAYDCAIVLALAAQEVESAKASTLALAIRTVTAGGVKCTTYADCLSKLRADEDIDYDGVSGLLAIDERGDPTSARFTTGVIKGGQLTEVSSTDIDFADLRRQQEAFITANFITQLQQALRFLGFFNGPIDGIESPELTAALAAFQASVGLPATGIYDAATDAALRAALGDYAYLLSSSTEGIQQLLTDLGFYTGPIDGIWSEEVTAAMRALQRELGVPETGVPDAATLQAAYERGLATGSTTTTTAPGTTVPGTAAPATTVPATTVPVTTPPATTPPATLPPETTPPAPETTVPEPPVQDLEDLFTTLNALPQYSTFVELLRAAGFTEDAVVIGPFTVFAPTNDAFDLLPAGTLDKLKADPATLAALLAYHIVEGKLPSTALVAGDLETINGALVKVEIDGTGGVTVGGAKVTEADIKASNGVIHGIAKVFTLPVSTLPA
jgi:branched-chain amino acid transport system substrate-binding protein